MNLIKLMLKEMEKSFISLSSEVDDRKFNTFGTQENNYTFFITSEIDEVITTETDPNYEQFLADIWVGIILTLIVLSCVCCMCSCLLYHKFQQWKRSMIEARNAVNIENGNADCESLPSYTIASGLPSYTEALEQLKKVKELTKVNVKGSDNGTEVWVPHTPPTPVARLTVSELFQFYKNPSVTPKS